MKILSIGNSFSQDAHRLLHLLAEANGADVETANLYIGGCSLETHWTNIIENNAYYDLEPNGAEAVRKISISEALGMTNWDVITLQQVSQLSGMPESFEPYLANIARTVRKAQPAAELYFHQTWAYEIDSTHGGFANYGCDQRRMFDCICAAVNGASKAIEAPIIPVGTVIQRLRESVPAFDYKNGGLSLCRDGFHLSYDYGRYAAAATWFHTLTGHRTLPVPFMDFESDLLEKINGVVNAL